MLRNRISETKMSLNYGKEYNLQYAWPLDVFLQGNTSGIVLSKKDKPYNTSFFEAFPLETFIRGEGSTVEEAEKQAWNIYQRYLNCKEHDFERLDDEGDGKCKNCGLRQSNVLPDIRKCEICKKSGYHEFNRQYYCAEHFYQVVEAETVVEKENKGVIESFFYNKKEQIAYYNAYKNILKHLIKQNIDEKEINNFMLKLKIYIQNYIFYAFEEKNEEVKWIKIMRLSSNYIVENDYEILDIISNDFNKIFAQEKIKKEEYNNYILKEKLYTLVKEYIGKDN